MIENIELLETMKANAQSSLKNVSWKNYNKQVEAALKNLFIISD